MKYNGKEVTSDFISQIMTRAFKNTDEIYPSAKEVYAILQAAQEVMQESRPNIKVGDRVRMGDDFGRVHDCEFPEIDEREHAFVIFDDGERGIYLHEQLTKIEEAQHGEG